MKLVLAVLQNMWGDHGVAPTYFRISPTNHSGRRLYRLVDESKARLLVTNAASVCTLRASDAAPTDLKQLTKAVTRHRWNLVLVCGCQAREAWAQLDHNITKHLDTIELPHPAWTHEDIPGLPGRSYHRPDV
jgi:hypothetical protein